MAEWLKGLRTPETVTRTHATNNRYGSGSRGAGELEAELDSSGGARSESSVGSLSAASRRNTPRVAGAYERPWKQETGLGPSGSCRSTPRARLAAAHRTPVLRQGSDLLDSGAAAADSASVAGSDDVSVMTEDDYTAQEGDSVQVFVRVRPVNAAEEAEAEQYSCTRIFGDRTLCVDLRHRPEPYQFKFDCVLPETTTQQEIFDRAGKPIVDNCMGGYNSSIFAYGQTGAGKTFTMQGPLKAAAAQDGNDERGLAPRVFEYLFTEIDKAQDDNCHENLTFCCRVSMLEIYNEVITDLLNPAATNLQIREDIKRGCYVEDLSEHLIQNVSDAMRLMRMGAENRHVGETRLNRESSRSHSVFACTLERQSKSAETGVTNVLFSRLNLIDLAGSERIHGGEHGGSQATGKHFKEACHINKSLTTLGRVIMELVEAQRSSSTAGRQGGVPGGSAIKAGAAAAAARMRHVPYRDSRLTFLLQDSLGGNAKTLMIANISPSSVSVQETLSTLHFMSRAKCIRNRAQINLDARGDVVLLQRELVRLNMELDNLRKGYTEPAIQESKELRDKLDKMSTAEGQIKIVLTNMEKENQNLKAERRRLDHKMAQIQKGAGQLDEAIFSLTTKLMSHEALAAAALQKSVAAAKAEHELELRLVELRLEAAQHESEGASELQEVVDDLQEQLASAQQQGAAASAHLDAANAQVAELKQQLDAAQQEASQQAQQMTMVQQEALAEQLGAAQAESAGLTEQLNAAQARAAQLHGQLAAAQGNAAGMSQLLSSAQDEAAALGLQLAAAQREAAALSQELQAAAQLKQEAAAVQAQLIQTQQDLQAAREQASSSAQEASSCLADVQAERDTAQASLQEAVSRNADLDEQLQELKAQLEQAQQLHQAEAAARQAEAEAAVGAAAAAAAIEQQLQQQLSDAQQLLAGKTEDLSGILADKDELHSRLGLKQQQCSELQQQLEAEQGRSADGRSQVAALESELSEARAALKDKGAALDVAQEQAKHLQQGAEAAAAAATARADQLSSDLAAARESSKSRQEELLKQVTEVHLRLSAAQTEQERLQDELDASSSDVGLLQARHAEAQGEIDNLRGQASSKGLDCELLRKKLAAADAAAAALRDDVDDTQQQVAELQHQLQQAEEAADTQQHQAAEQLSNLQRQLLDARQELDARAFDAGQMQRRMEELSNRLADKSASLEAAKEEVKGLKASVSKLEGAARQLDAQLADKMALIRQLQADNEGLAAHNAELAEQNARQNVLLMEKLSVNELALKEQIVYNARNKQAMNEIRKVINWAQQPVAPPHSSAAGAAVGASCPVRPGSSQRHRAAQQQQQLDSGSAPSSPAAFAPDALGCGLPPHSPAADAAELLPDGTRAAAGPLPVTGGSARHAQLSSHARHHRHHQQGQHQGRDRYGDRASERYGELLVTAAASSAEGIAGSTNISHGSTGSTAGPMAGAGQSGDLEVESSKQARSSSAGHTAVAAAARRSSGGRDTAPLVPLASSSHEALQLHPSGSGGIGRGRMRGGAESPTRRSSGSKQHLLAAAAAVQHRAQPDQHTHHHQQQALELGRDDLLLGAAPGLGQEGSLDTQEGHLLCSGDSRSELPSDGSTRQLLVPQRVSSPLTSPKQQLHGSAARARGGRDAGSRGAHGLRMGSDGASFSAALAQQKQKQQQQQHRGSSSSGSSKRPAVLQPGAASSVALSVSTEWSGGARDSAVPDMRLPAAIVGGDCEPEP